MLVTGNMTLDYLVRKQVVSKKLFNFLDSYSVRTLEESMNLKEWVVFPEKLLEELNRIKNNIDADIATLRDGVIANIYKQNLISKRLYNCFRAFGFKKIHHLFYYISKNGGKSTILLEKKNFGRGCLEEVDEIISFLEYHNYSIYEFIEELEYANKAHPITFSTKIIDLHKLGIISVRLFNCLYNNLEFSTIGDILDYINTTGSINNFLNTRNFGNKSLVELHDLLRQVENSSEEDLKCDTENDQEESPTDEFILQYNELIKNNIYKSSIEHYYETSKAKLPARAIHVLEENFNSILEVACLYFEGLDIGKLKNCGKKTFDDLNPFITNLYTYISSLFTEDSREAEIILLGNTYPFLSENELEFVVDYKVKTSHLPMFYILYHYLIKSSSRSERIFCRYYGLKGEPEDLRDISVSLDVSFERCRQLLAQNKIEESSLCSSVNWNSYDFFDNTLFYNNYDYKSILDNEGLEHLSLFAFAGLCSLVKNVKVCKMGKVSGRKYVVSEKFYNSFDLKGCIKDIESTLNKRCTEDINLPISFFIDSYWLSEPTFDVSEVEDIIIYILKEDYGVELGEDKILYLQQNAIDRSGEIYKIIEEYGKPMHINLIRDALISRYPELSDMTIESIRAQTLKHPHIEPLGKSSTYAIDKWELYIGTIRDLLYDILSVEKEPMYIEDLYDEVSLIYPNTSIKSITSTMVSDKLERFVRFVGSYYGVTGKTYNEEYVVWDAEAFSRKNFDERIIEFEIFLKSHHHLPRFDKDNDEEAALSRWYRRVKASDASITSEQQQRLSDLLVRNADYLITATEYSFYRYCEEFKAYIEDNMEFPTLETDSAKYGWFKKNIKIYKDFEDRRKAYFEDLIEFLYTYGFEV